ncbi:MAG: three-Cys-motif partner protein TcmP [Alphaproteobacteria bacterium]|nr:three-Cys-motif partner protein TcmP [Alphaproteobacteria bacterium]MBT5859934.1 three-Cys-motif partner protein TcmP [Alphaproteobacteria bacterium]
MKPPEFYEGREQTYLKHFFLEKYLERVAYNILSFRNEFVFVDGFAGPWKSSNDALEDTSFVIALDQLRKIKDAKETQGKTAEMRCFFNEKNSTAFRELRKAAQSVTDIAVTATCQDFEELVPEIIRFIGKSFSLTFIDPTGWTGFSLNMIEPLLRLPGEALINLMFDHVNRFIESPNSTTAKSLDALFGDSDWYQEVERKCMEGEDREDAILAVYCERIRTSGNFEHVTSTRVLKPLSDRSYFHLIYATRHWKGLVEFRNVEKQAIDEQERVRDGAKLASKVAHTGQTEMFGTESGRVGPPSYAQKRTRQLELAATKARRLIAGAGVVKYEALLGEILEMPLVWESDIKAWLQDWVRDGTIRLPDLRGRERTPKTGHDLVWAATYE